MKKPIEAKTGCILTYIMEEKGVSFAKLAQKTGISMSSLKRYATCKQLPEIDRAFIIADNLGIDVRQIWSIYGKK